MTVLGAWGAWGGAGRRASGYRGVRLARMTPTQEARYAIDWNVSRDDLDSEVQLEYDRLTAELEALPRVEAPVPATKSSPTWHYLIIPGAVLIPVLLWLVVATPILYNLHMNFTTLKSDISSVRLPAGYERESAYESGNCAAATCTLTEWWVWRGSTVRSAVDACRDVGRAMDKGLPEVGAGVGPRGAECEYFTILASFFRPDLGKRSAEGVVWTNNKESDNPGGYKVELLVTYGDPPY